METLNQVTRVLKLVLLVALIAIVSFLVASYFFAMALGLELFYLNPYGLAISKLPYMLLYRSGPWILLFATLIIIFIPANPTFGLVFAFLWCVFLLCFVAAWKFRESFHNVIKNSFSRPIGYHFKNFLFAMPVITSMVLTAVIFIVNFQEAHGVPTGEAPLPEDRFVALFDLSYHSLFEEIGFRVTTIGVFMIAYLLWVGGKASKMSWGQRLKISFLALLYPEKGKKLVGLRTVGDSGVRGGISSAEWMIVVLTSAIFGLAHYLGGGWEVGKITSVFVQGFAMGLTYLLYGVQAPILLHWFFDYYLSVYSLALGIYPNLSLLVSVIDVAIMGLGTLGWAVAIVVGASFLAKAIAKKTKSPDQNTGSP